MRTIIHWKEYSEGQTIGTRWYVVILRSVDFKEVENKENINEWIIRYEFNLAWGNDNRFWQEHQDITHRVLYYAKQPCGFVKKEV